MARFDPWGTPARNQPAAKGRRRQRGRVMPLLSRNFGFIALMALMGWGAGTLWPDGSEGPQVRSGGQLVAYAPHRHFPICGTARRVNCVVDGDTFWFDGERVRIADIDAPEISSPQCGREAELGQAATRRLQALLNEGRFELRRGTRDRDRYDRLLRTVHRDGRSLGHQLVAEGLARHWDGQRRSWCG